MLINILEMGLFTNTICRKCFGAVQVGQDGIGVGVDKEMKVNCSSPESACHFVVGEQATTLIGKCLCLGSMGINMVQHLVYYMSNTIWT